MRSIFYILLSCFVFSSCEIINDPYDDTSSLSGSKKVLLEDFTGHTCSNCPEATRTADALKEIYKENLIIVATHCSFFANPKPVQTGQFTADYRTTTGNALDDYFLIEEAGLPKGMVNRKPFEGNLLLSQTAWGSAVAKAIGENAKIELEVTAEHTASNNVITVSAEISYLEFSKASHQLVVYVLEDSIVSWQKDGSVNIEDYVHKDMLRANITENVFGQKVSNVVLGPGDKISKSYSMTAPSEWTLKNLKVVVFVHDNTSKEVLQAEEVKLKLL